MSAQEIFLIALAAKDKPAKDLSSDERLALWIMEENSSEPEVKWNWEIVISDFQRGTKYWAHD